MAIDWAPFVDLVRRHDRFLLTTHVRPDPDGLGSALGLADALERLGKHVRLVISSNWPPRYDFMDPGRRIQRFQLPGDDYRDAQVIVVLDTGTWGQLGDFGTFMKSMNAAKVVIDHHVTQEDLGGLRLLDTRAEATGRLVHEAITALGQKASPPAANFLFSALATDTGWFRHQNTTAATFRLGAELMDAGARVTSLHEQLYEQHTLPRLRLLGLMLERMQLVENGRVAFSEIRVADYAATGAIPQDTEDMVQYTRSIAGVEAGLFFLEQPAGGIKISFRAREPIDVATVAAGFGGGGHRLAAGATLATTLDEAKKLVLDAIAKALPPR